MDTYEIITLLIVIATLFTSINRTILKLEATIGLMVLALLSSMLIFIAGYGFPQLKEGSEEIMKNFDFTVIMLDIMLPFLLFAGALHINLKKLAEEKWSILSLALGGVLISTFIVGTLMFYVLDFVHLSVDYIHCLLFGALISPTDPIAVLALLKKTNISENLQMRINGESLFNDGIGVVVFLTILHIAQSTPGSFEHLHFGPWHYGPDSFGAKYISMLFMQEAVGGVVLGLILGYFGYKILEWIPNEFVQLEVLVTLSFVMGGTVIATFLHVSGPLAMVVLGIALGNQGRSEKMSEAVGDYVYRFWDLIDESLNAILFILIGLEMLVIKFTGEYIFAGFLAIAIVLFARLVGVSIPIGIMSLGKKFEKGTIKILTWGGLRGGISVALALALPSLGIIELAEKEFDIKDLIVSLTFIVVVFAILVQGLTIKKVAQGVEDKQAAGSEQQ